MQVQSSRLFGAVALAVLACAISMNRAAHANGEAIDGFPNWSERVMLEWVNRARSDPQADLANCPATNGNCFERACYKTASPPRYMIDDLNHSARFHSSHMMSNGYFDHPSHCTLKTNIDNLFPATCNGAASCSCMQGNLTSDTTTWTDPGTRLGYFGQGGSWSEIIAAGYQGPNAMFYGWLYEPTNSSTCGFHGNDDNGHRFIILTNGYGENAGAGYTSGGSYGTYATMDFAGTAPAHPKIPSGAHYPEQAASVDAWANWYDTAGPKSAQINVDGVCSNLSLARGNVTNGAWHATVNNVSTGCHRYVFSFVDSGGQTVVYPSTGSLGIGNGSAQCPDWSSAEVKSCSNAIFASGFEP